MGAMMQAGPECDGEIAYDLEDFCKDHGHPDGRVFTVEVTYGAVTYVYADVIGTVCGREVVFSLDGADLVLTRKAH
jgi:hypothetical protein